MPNYKRMTVAELYQELQNSVVQTAEGLRRMARVWAELKNRGEDVSRYDSPLLMFLPDIESGKLMPEMLLMFGGRSQTFLEQVATLTPEEQMKLATGDGYVQIIDQKGGVPRKAKFAYLTTTKLRQVIGGGVIRTPKEQEEFVPPPRTYTPRPEAVSSKPEPEPEPEIRIEDFASLGQWQAISEWAEERGIHPYQALLRWVPPAIQTRGKKLDREMEASKRRGVSAPMTEQRVKV